MIRAIAGFGFILFAATAVAADADAGLAYLDAQCGACHATGTQGDSPLAQAPAFRDLGGSYPPEALEEALAEGIITGHPDMPEIAANPRDIDNAIAWLERIQPAR
ncbi:MAG: c-type cytochrome [Rhizobiaceae bacterium]